MRNMLEALESFHRMVVGSRDPKATLEFVHQQIELALEPVDETPEAIRVFEAELPDNLVHVYPFIAEREGVTAAEVVENHRPKQCVAWLPTWLSRPVEIAVRPCDAVLFLAVLHDSVGAYRSTPLKPRWDPKGSIADLEKDILWYGLLDGLPKPEDSPADFVPPKWFETGVMPKVAGWLDEAETLLREAGLLGARDDRTGGEHELTGNPNAEIPGKPPTTSDFIPLRDDLVAILQTLEERGPLQRLALFQRALNPRATKICGRFDKQLERLRKDCLITRGKPGPRSPGINLTDLGRRWLKWDRVREKHSPRQY